ncbi:MarR family winged helix-turn-helix transcriptional regulator [Paractinoplanes globisporus]|uniref:MarR family winged helix-turn-helix transcriptional regulator n=1 Tax=Paractinoplanes globisporus TaxID=113565 RepID=A0ABW6WHH9_9ACTN|nr:MarR family transcriptional regulator [Actinoplanes globisporus]
MRRATDLMHLLTRAERLLARRIAGVLESSGLSLDAWRVVTLLADGKGHTMSSLSEGASLPPASLTRLVDHLVDENLVYRRIDEIDRRRIRAHLTMRGRRLHEKVASEISADLPEISDDVELAERLGSLIRGLSAAPVTGITL